MPAQAIAIPAQYEPCQHPDPTDLANCGTHSTAVATVVLDHPAGQIRIDEPLCQYHVEVRVDELVRGRSGAVLVWYVRPLATAQAEPAAIRPYVAAVAVGA